MSNKSLVDCMWGTGDWVIPYVLIFGAACVLVGFLFASLTGSAGRGIAMAVVMSFIAPSGAFILLGFVAALGASGVWWALGAIAVAALALMGYVFI